MKKNWVITICELIICNKLKLIALFFDLDEIRGLVSLIRLLSSSGQIFNMEYTATYACNKLLKLIVAVSSLSYIGAGINKNCLLTIGNIMIRVDELHVEKRYISFISTLCGHVDFEIRSYSWSILLKLASSIHGAQNLVQGKLCRCFFDHIQMICFKN